MRRTALKPSRGTQWPPAVAREIAERNDFHCVGPRAGIPGECLMPRVVERHHIRAGGMGMKSRSTVDNGTLLCVQVHHPWATEHGREARLLLLAWVAAHPIGDAS